MQPPKEPHGLLAHYFSGEGFPEAQGSLSLETFQALLREYGKRLCPAKEWLDRLAKGTLRDAVALTFDDGLYEAYAIVRQLLASEGLTAFWSIYTGPYVGVENLMERYRWLRNHGFPGGVEGFYAEWAKLVDPDVGCPEDYLANYTYLTDADRRFRWWRDMTAPAAYEDTMDDMVTNAGLDDLDRQWWMTPSQLRDLHRSGHVLGIHTHSHPYDMARMSLEQTCLEYATSRAVLASVLECDPNTLTTMSHPRGLAHPQSPVALERMGFTLGWGSSMAGAAPWMTPRWSTGNWRL